MLYKNGVLTMCIIVLGTNDHHFKSSTIENIVLEKMN